MGSGRCNGSDRALGDRRSSRLNADSKRVSDRQRVLHQPLERVIFHLEDAIFF